MTNIPFEFWVILGLFGLYLYDSSRLVHYNQVYFFRGFKSKISVTIPAKTFSFFKQYLFLVQALHSYRIVFQSQWNLNNSKQLPRINETSTDETEQIFAAIQILKKIQIINLFSFILTLLIFPVLFLTKQSYVLLLITLLFIYLANIVQILYVFRHRKALNISKKFYLSLLVDALFCPPFALNIIQKISLNIALKTDAIVLAEILLKQDDLYHFSQDLYEQIEELKQIESKTDSPQYLQLEQIQQRLKHLENHSKIDQPV